MPQRRAKFLSLDLSTLRWLLVGNLALMYMEAVVEEYIAIVLLIALIKSLADFLKR